MVARNAKRTEVYGIGHYHKAFIINNQHFNILARLLLANQCPTGFKKTFEFNIITSTL